MGVKPPRVSWARWRWYFRSIQTTMASRSSCRLVHRCWLSTFVCSSDQNDCDTCGMLRGMMVMEPQRAAMLRQRPAPDSDEIAARAKMCAKLFLKGAASRS